MKRKKLKKRLKRQLMNRNKEVKRVVKNNAAKTAAIVAPVERPLPKHEEQKRLYQIALDRKYGGNVTAKGNYYNQRAVLVHYCNNCGQDFYGKPSYMLGKDHQRHICTLPYGSKDGVRTYARSTKHKKRKNSKNSTDKWELFYNMVIEDFTPKEIAKKLDIPLPMVIGYFKAEGLI